MDIIQNYVTIDIETTGLNPRTDKIIEIAAIKIIDGNISEEKTALVNPHQALSPAIQGLTGINDQMLEDAPGIDQVIGEFVEFCEGFPILGHNVRFDYSFLKHAAVNNGLIFEKDSIDTLKLCRRFMPADVSKSLGSACGYYQVTLTQAHRAMGDARAAHQLYQTLLKRYAMTDADAFSLTKLVYHAKKEQPASKRQKEVLRELIKYHKIDLTVQIDYLSRNEASRLTDKIISQYGRIIKR